MVGIYIRLANAEKINFDVDLQSTIKELKSVIAASQNLEQELLTLVFKGKILKDEQTLEAANLMEGSVVHMVVMKKKQAASPPKPTPVVNPPSVAIPETPKKEEPAPKPEIPKFSSSFSPFGRSGLGQGSFMNNAGGLDSLDAGSMKGMAGMLKQNPDLFIEMMKMDPGFKNVLEKNPQLENALHDPATLDYLCDVMSDPDQMKEAMRKADTAMNEISSIPGGDMMLDRILTQYYEPLDKAQDSKHFSKGTNTTQSVSDEATLPNLWGSAPARPTMTSPFSNMNLNTRPSTEGNSMSNLNALNGSEDFLSNLVSSNPELVANLIKMTPEYQQMAQSNPMMAEMMTSPEYLKQALSPEMIQLARELQGSGLGGMNGLGGMSGLGSMNGLGSFGARQELTSEQIRQRYPTQIQQIEEMGFFVDDNVLQMLHRFNDKVKQQCPVLCPVFYPGEVTEKQVMKMVKEKKRIPKQPKKCSICESCEGELKPQVFCDYDIEARKMIIKDIKCICPTCKSAMDIHTIMNLLVNKSKDSEEVDSFIRHFLLVNGHNPENIALIEEIISSCYSLHIIMKGLLSSSVDLLRNC